MDGTIELNAPFKYFDLEMTEGQNGEKSDVLSCASSEDADQPAHWTPLMHIQYKNPRDSKSENYDLSLYNNAHMA